MIAEKLTQATLYNEVLGRGRRREGYFEIENGLFGRTVIVWTWGHADRLEEPRDEDEKMRNWWSDDWPHVNRHPKILPADDDKAKSQIAVARRLLPRCALVIGATDPDREGETIWRRFLELIGLEPDKLKRMICAEMNAAPVRAAFDQLVDPDRYYGRFVAGAVRAATDMWEGTNLTVACTTALRPADLGQGFWPMGRVKGATLGILHRRHRELADFRETVYFEIAAEVAAGGGSLTLRHAPPPDRRLLDRNIAQALAAGSVGAEGPLRVEQKQVEAAPPKLFTKTAFLTAAGARWGWSGKKSADILQRLYQDLGLITYPRSGLRCISQTDVAQAPEVMRHLRGLGDPLRSAIDGMGGHLTVRKSVVNDKAVAEASHTAIIPTLTSAAGQTLTADEEAAYRLIAERYVGSFMPSALGLRTTILMIPTAGPCRGLEFRAAGTVKTDPGWRAVTQEDERNDDGNDDGAGNLPPVRDGEPGRITAASLDRKCTKPPALYTETSILEAMVDVHRLVPEDQERLREVLKSSKGVGTEATRETVVAELIGSGLVIRHPPRRKGAPPVDLSDQGTMLVERLLTIAPELVRPETTALLELELDRVEKARDRTGADRLADRLLEEADSRVRRQFEAITADRKPRAPGGGRPAGDSQLAFVRRIVTGLGLPVSETEIAGMTVKAASDFIDEHKPAFEASTGGNRRPGDARGRRDEQTRKGAGRREGRKPDERRSGNASPSRPRPPR